MLKNFLLIILLLIVAAGSSCYYIYEYQLNSPMPLINDWRYTLPSKANISQVAKDLMKQDLLNYPEALVWVCLARVNEKAHKIKAGEYQIPVGTTPQQFLEILVSGKPLQHSLTLPPGWNFRQVMAAVHQHPALKHTLVNLTPEEIMTRLGFSTEHPEGRFYPDTYHFPTGMSDVEFLRRAYQMMEKELKTVWQKRRADLPLKSAYEALILASIVEKETAAPEERPLIAGVFIRRLNKKMLLQTDPTVIYALGETFDGNIRKQDLSIDNPYNTYRYKGLPPTPIAMPGQAALEAVINPAEGDALFFVAKGNGYHHFSTSEQEHECAVIEYQLKNDEAKRRSRCNQYRNCAACQRTG